MFLRFAEFLISVADSKFAILISAADAKLAMAVLSSLGIFLYGVIVFSRNSHRVILGYTFIKKLSPHEVT